jgi:hypothetical protein
LPPSSGVMNPYPFSLLNHFTVPVGISSTFPPLRATTDPACFCDACAVSHENAGRATPHGRR